MAAIRARCSDSGRGARGHPHLSRPISPDEARDRCGVGTDRTGDDGRLDQISTMAEIDEVGELAFERPQVVERTSYGHRAGSVGGQPAPSAKGKQKFAWLRPFSKADLDRFGDQPIPAGDMLAVRVGDLAEKEAAGRSSRRVLEDPACRGLRRSADPAPLRRAARSGRCAGGRLARLRSGRVGRGLSGRALTRGADLEILVRAPQPIGPDCPSSTWAAVSSA